MLLKEVTANPLRKEISYLLAKEKVSKQIRDLNMKFWITFYGLLGEGKT